MRLNTVVRQRARGESLVRTGRVWRRPMMALLVLAALSPLAPRAEAQVSPERRAALAAELEAAADNLDSARLPRLEDAAEQLQRDYVRLREYLSRSADPANAAAWLEYIGFDQLAEAIEGEATPVEQGRIARDVYWRMSRNQAGLERTPLVEFRDSLQQFVAAATFRDPEATVSAIGRQLEQLAEMLREGEAMLSAEEVARMNRMLQFIDSSGMAPEVVVGLRNAFGGPNARILVGQGLVSRFVTRPVDRTAPSDECILGTRVLSTANLNGGVTATLLPSTDGARILLNLDAAFSSVGTGYQRSVRVRTRGMGHVSAQRILTVNDGGVYAGPVSADAWLSSQILGVEHHLGLVRRIATRRAAELKPQADRIASGRLEQRVAREFGDETGQQLAQGNLLPRSQVADVLTRLDVDQPERDWTSTHQYLTLALTVRSPRQATTAIPPTPVINPYDAVIQIQESAVDNAASLVLAERTLRDTELAAFAEELFPALKRRPPSPTEALDAIMDATAQATAGVTGNDDEADDDAVDADEEPLWIRFAAVRPVVFEARQGRLRVGIRGTRFQQGDRVLDQALEIAAHYVPETRDGAAILVRQGPVEVLFPGGRTQRLSIQQAGLRRNIEERFSEVFPETLLGQLSSLPMASAATGSGGLAGIASGIRPRVIVAQHGWLTIALR